MNFITKVIAVVGIVTTISGLYANIHAQPLSNSTSVSVVQTPGDEFYQHGVEKADRGNFKEAIQDFTQREFWLRGG
jgi:outer membrane protein assembly factor BamD (BamD/ComL family)